MSFFIYRLPNYPETPYNKEFTENCSGLIPSEKYMQKMPSAQLVRDAVYAFATALNDIHRDKCGGEPGWCDAMDSLNGNLLRQYLHKVKFHGRLYCQAYTLHREKYFSFFR